MCVFLDTVEFAVKKCEVAEHNDTNKNIYAFFYQQLEKERQKIIDSGVVPDDICEKIDKLMEEINNWLTDHFYSLDEE